jgi:hypothetical protein
MIVILCTGCALLFGFLLVPPAQFNNTGPILAAGNEAPARKASEKNEGEQTTGSTREIPVRVLGLESGGSIAIEHDSRTAWLQQRRIGANLLIRSGYLKSASITVDTSGGPPPQILYGFVVQDSIIGCTRGKPDEGQVKSDESPNIAAEADPDKSAMETTAGRLAISAVAVEKFHRNVVQRRLEWLYAGMYFKLFGQLPDLSLGPAQIRVSRLRQIASEDGGDEQRYKVFHAADAELAGVLADECEALRLASTIMYYYLKKASELCPPIDKQPADYDPKNCPEDWNIFAAQKYVGQRRTTNAVIDYAPIVAGTMDSFKGS